MGVMYHCSSKDNRDSIKQFGLLAGRDRTGFSALFLTDVRPAPQKHFDVWTVDTTDLELDEDFTGEPEQGQWWMHYGDIGPERLSRHVPRPTPCNEPSL